MNSTTTESTFYLNNSKRKTTKSGRSNYFSTFLIVKFINYESINANNIIQSVNF